MKRTPKQRGDGRCVLNDCEKSLLPLALATGDPFCSSWCCRIFHGVVFPSDEGSRRWAIANQRSGAFGRKPPSVDAKAGNSRAVRRSTAKRRAAEARA